jgi:ABC-type bacteriocin/lantibiotic exporter with double-glycine peptidase domain
MLLRKFILSNSWFRAAAAVALIQQILVASGTFLLGDITTRLPSEGVSWTRSLALLFCMAISGSLLFYFMNIFSLRAQHLALKNFLSSYFDNTFGRTLFWRNSDERKKRHDMMCREAQDAIQEGSSFFLDVWTTGWNILLNTVSVILVIGTQSGAVIIAAGIISSLIVHFASERISRNAIDEMDDQNQLNSHLTSSWDNLTLGNSLSFNLWKKRFYLLQANSNTSAEKSLSTREMVLSSGNFITSTAIVASVLVQAWLNQSSITAVIALFAMLPRTMQINMHVQVIHSYWAGWQRMRERLSLASECLSEFPETQPNEYININALQITGTTLLAAGIEKSQTFLESEQGLNSSYKVAEILERVQAFQSGRLTIRGENGAGKSVLLTALKEKLSRKAFYLPAHHSLELPGLIAGNSHGEKAIAALDALADADSDVNVLLLDEWDANLSPENRSLMSAKIASIAQKKLVIEVRHNHDSLSSVPSYA